MALVDLTRIEPARTAGLIYLVVVVTGIFSLAYVPSQLIISGDAEKTVASAAARQGLLRAGIATAFIRDIAFLLLPLAFYRLLAHKNRNIAKVMVVFAVVGVPISLGALINLLQMLTLLSGKAYLANYSGDQLNAAVMLALAKYNSGILVASIFWGLWLLPLGYLMFHSGMLPKVLGVLLMLGCLGYLVNVFGETLIAGYSSTIFPRIARAPASLGEIGTCLWLVAFGVRDAPPNR
jgi:hypothetical protein